MLVSWFIIRGLRPQRFLPRSNLQKEKTIMGDNNDEIDMNDVVVAQPAAADKNELIMLLMQQIAEMRVEMQRMRDSPNPV